MQKKGGMRWQRRYFVLYQNGSKPAQLSYFKDKTYQSGDARATLDLTSDTKIEILLGKPHAFQVILKGTVSLIKRRQVCVGRALKVAAETHEDRDMWMRCLRACISIDTSQTVVHVR